MLDQEMHLPSFTSDTITRIWSLGAYAVLSVNGPNASAANHPKAPLKSDFPNWENQIAIRKIRSKVV
jgi:hypothetical protein